MTRLWSVLRSGLSLGLFAAVLALLSQPAQAESYYVAGAGGVPLAVTVAGPKDAPAIIFLHGIGLGAAAFKPQFDSELAKHFRMVAFDLRGHGQSGKPAEEQAYTDPAVWAEDVKRVIAATGIRRPVLVGWSYGTLVAADYLRAYGPDGLSGLVLVSATGGLVPPQRPSTPPDPKVMADLKHSYQLHNSPSFADQQEAIGIVLPLLTHGAPVPGWLDDARILESDVPAYVQGALRRHPSANADLAPRLQSLPMMLLYGGHDGAMSDGVADSMRRAFPQLAVHRFDRAGHSMFAEDPRQFNRLLAAFVSRNWKEGP